MEITKEIYVNYEGHTLVITKAFEKKARYFNSEEFKELKKARKDFPNFEIVVKSTQKKKKSSNPYSGLTYNYMEKYITAKNKDLLKEFNIMRGIPENEEDALPEKYEYREIQKWFLEKFPEIKAFYEKRNAAKKSA